MKRILLLLLVIFVFALSGCDRQNSDLISIKIDGPEKIECGNTYQYEAIFNPVDYLNQKVIWSSSDETKLIMDENTGEVTPINGTDDGGMYIYATSVEKTSVQGIKKIYIDEISIKLPVIDLNGYNIRIANNEKWVIENDPYSEAYVGNDKYDKREVWEEIEKLYNCNIEYVSYPDTGWGSTIFEPSRLATLALNGTIDYDFLYVPNNWIKYFLEKDALIGLKEYYLYHGRNMMDDIQIMDGTYNDELYTFTSEKSNIYNVMYYNIGLFEMLKAYNENLIEPAQMFLDGNWTHSNFLKYCEEVQNTFKSLFGDKGTPGNENQEYYAVSGYDSFWWVGLATNDGEPLIDVKTSEVNIATPHKESAANIVKELYNKGYASPNQAIDAQVKEWSEGKALFNTGDLWFVNEETRWLSDMWGEDTRYGYVPWPRADDMKFEDIQISLAGDDRLIIMPIGRNYEGYGEDCTSENIYKVLVELYYKLKEVEKTYEEASSLIYPEEYYKNAESEASLKAFVYVQELINNGKYYYDPIIVPNNSICSSNRLLSDTGYSIKHALNNYTKNMFSTWKESVNDLEIEDILQVEFEIRAK